MQRRTALLSLAGLAATACTESKPQFKAVDITGADYARDFPLPDADGKPRGIKDFAGKVVVLFLRLHAVPRTSARPPWPRSPGEEAAGPRWRQGARRVRDGRSGTRHPRGAEAYMGNFDPGFVALRGTPDQVAAVAKDFKVYFKKVEGKAPGSYTMDHSAASYVYDTQGRLRLYVRYGSGPQALADDVRLLLKA
jgi:protein SCO1/2